jgi:protein O-GlcNAc transferase
LADYPGFAFGWKLLGGILQMQGKDALHAFKKVIEFTPDDPEAHYNLGVALKATGRLDDAAASYRKAIAIKPDYAEAHSNLGNTLKDLGRLEDAIASYKKAVALNPDFFMTYFNMGNAQRRLENYEDAEASFRRTVEIKPDHVQAYCNLGTAQLYLGQYNAAEASYRRVLEIKPDFAVAYSNLGNALGMLGQYSDAEVSYRRALEIKPDYDEAQSNLLFTLNYTMQPAEYCLEEARKYGQLVAGKVSSRFTSWQCADPTQRLRVGLVSGDFWMHSVGHFLEGLLPHIDPARIELIAYPTHNREDELTARIRPCFSAWKPLYGKSDEDAARLIHADGVHVLLDLAGHTEHNRLPMFAWKPAPVQATWLGLPATTGVAEMDYVLGDPYALPAEFEKHFSETVWRMPESCLCLAVPSSSVEVAKSPALLAGYVTFGSFNNLAKMNDTVVATWAHILEAVPNSRLLLKTKQLSNPIVCEKIRERFASCGIAAERLMLCSTVASRDDHLAMYNKVDIALDTFPYPGVTTSAEALWMGVPVLSMHGDRFLSRTASSIAINAGLSDWIAQNEADYIAKAVAFSSDLERLSTLRAGLREQVRMSPLFDAPRFARGFEEALWGMWQARGEKSISS